MTHWGFARMRCVVQRVHLNYRYLVRAPPHPRTTLASHRSRSCTTRVFASHHDAFYSEQSFDSFSLSAPLLHTLKACGYRKPSQIQGLGMRSILEGKDVLLAAETGSGKTLAYLLPLITRILQAKEELGSHDINSHHYDEVDGTRRAFHFALIMCPTMDLCRQVESVLALLNQQEKTMVDVRTSPSGLSRYKRRPDILLGTPGSLYATLLDMGKEVAMRILSRVGYVVVDEADLMFAGSYRPQIDRLIQMIYLSERELAIDYLSSVLDISKDEFLKLPRHVKRAAVQNGLQGMIENGYKPPNEQSSVNGDSGAFWRTQYIFSGATIPSLGTKNIKDEIQELFPNVEIISTKNLHKASEQLTHNWVDISGKDRMETILETIHQDEGFENRSVGKILVFAKDSLTTESTCRYLQDQGLHCVSYHKRMSGVFRSANLEKFRSEDGIIMVSTDGLSRGMDILDITHIIQCYFAPSAITFVHRVGRTGRAGKEGKVTSFIMEEDLDLVNAIRQCIDEGIPIEGAFSRDRSFRKKIKRYGRFIPRGHSPSEADTRSNNKEPNEDLGESRPGCTELGCPI